MLLLPKNLKRSMKHTAFYLTKQKNKTMTPTAMKMDLKDSVGLVVILADLADFRLHLETLATFSATFLVEHLAEAAQDVQEGQKPNRVQIFKSKSSFHLLKPHLVAERA